MKRRRWIWLALLATLLAALIAVLYYVVIPDWVQKVSAEWMGYDHFVTGSESVQGASSCKTCHPQQYEQWSQSLHAKAYTESRFAVRAEQQKWGMPEELCLRCHSPLANQGLSKEEGISCEVCHGPGETHAVVHDVCNDCHGVQMGETSPSDMILSTPFEFADSAARKNGLDCVDCHMSKQGDIPDHAFQGSRTAPQSYKGIIQIEGIEQRGNQVIVTVMNTVSGHWMPTGDETKVIFLEITAFDAQDQIVYRDEYRFEKVVFFFRTMPISGAKDTRLRDGERREIAFDVPALATRLNAAVKIKPRLWNNEIVEFVIDQQAAQILPAR